MRIKLYLAFIQLVVVACAAVRVADDTLTALREEVKR
jgi:hypothetical protein